MSGRISRDAWALGLAVVTARRATCLRRAVGAVLLDADGFVLATGYNGRFAGAPHCNEEREPTVLSGAFDTHVYPHACAGAAAASGTSLDACEAIHAEANALLRCRDVSKIATAYVTASPCVACAKLLLNTACRRVVFLDPYPHPAARDLWLAAGRTWERWETAAAVSPLASIDYKKVEKEVETGSGKA